jgi:hypothetical protein
MGAVTDAHRTATGCPGYAIRTSGGTAAAAPLHHAGQRLPRLGVDRARFHLQLPRWPLAFPVISVPLLDSLAASAVFDASAAIARNRRPLTGAT